MPVIFCKEFGKDIYPNPQSFWNINDVGVKCDRWNTTNTITIENGELGKQV
jgi:hypothetical protein